MRYFVSLIILLFSVSTSSAVFAQGRGNGHTAGQGKGRPAAVDTPKTHTQPATPKTHPTPKADAKSTPHTNPKLTTAPTTIVTTRTPTSHVVKNPRLEARLLRLLPLGTNINEAAKGFKNWGQFVAAVHVSNNQNIPFMELKSRMVGPDAVSLGQAIQASRTGTTTSTSAVKIAEHEAAEDFRHARNDRN
jgi:hypothetical protein